MDIKSAANQLKVLLDEIDKMTDILILDAESHAAIQFENLCEYFIPVELNGENILYLGKLK